MNIQWVDINSLKENPKNRNKHSGKEAFLISEDGKEIPWTEVKNGRK